MKTVLASVWDKTGLVEFLSVLQTFEPLRIVATGSTAQYLEQAGFTCETVESITHFPEILDGRVKTLHPQIFGGILAKDTVSHQTQCAAHQIPQFDVVIVNLYPFANTVKANKPHDEVIENIDVGGVALIRAAAKNYARLTVLCHKDSYTLAIQELQQNQFFGDTFRKAMAQKAFEHTSTYDAMIAGYLLQQPAVQLPNRMNIALSKISDLRYGENPQEQAAWFYQQDTGFESPFEQLQGKDMSANNLVDAYAAYNVVREFPANAACCVIKHSNPCGVAIGDTIEQAFEKALAADPVSAFGGVFALNQPLTLPTAEQLAQQFVEIVLAPDFTDEARDVLAAKKNVRLLKTPTLAQPHPTESVWQLKDLGAFGVLLQECKRSTELPALSTVTTQPMPDSIRGDVAVAWAVVKHLTSNAIAVVKDGQTIGLGMGQTSRIASMNQALAQAGEKARGAVLASDGFFPATDNIEAAAQAGISVIVQPGGSIKDDDVIDAANQHGLAMVLTHQRCFKH